MTEALLMLLMNIIGVIALIVWIVTQIKDYNLLTLNEFLTWKRFKYSVLLALIVGGPIFLVKIRLIGYHEELTNTILASYTFYCWIIAFLISIIWLIYILKLDIYQKEKWYHVALIFVLSFFSSYLCDILYPLFHYFGFEQNGNVVNDFLYCVFGIGLIEETVKFIPFFILLKFSKAIDEPYDYLLYASVAALGFAFNENILYLSRYGIEIISARAFFAAVAHMTFCCTVAYGLLLKKYRYTKFPTVLVFLFFFGIAMFVHGFYDFWLINEYVTEFRGLTTLFFLITIHLWFIMKNNAINISPQYDASIELNNDRLKHYLVISLAGLFMLSYLYVVIIYGEQSASSFFRSAAYNYGYIIFYLVMSFSRYKIVEGFIKPFNLPFNFIVPGLKKAKSNTNK